MGRKISRIVTLQVFSRLIVFFVSYMGAILVILLRIPLEVGQSKR